MMSKLLAPVATICVFLDWAGQCPACSAHLCIVCAENHSTRKSSIKFNLVSKCGGAKDHLPIFTQSQLITFST